jgi:hypothetical protein
MTGSPGKTGFVIMPFRPSFDHLYRDVLSVVLREHGLIPIRADEIYSTRAIVDDIVQGIAAATAVIADTTGRNPNVNYELGVAHTLKKPTIIITQSLRDVPFDYKHRRVHAYRMSEHGLRSLRNALDSSLNVISAEGSGVEELNGRWVGWYKEPDDPEWHPTAQEIRATANEITVIAYGEASQSQSICAHAERDPFGTWRLIWTYDSKTLIGGYDLADHTGTHIALFTPGAGEKRLMEGMYFNNRRQKNHHLGTVGEFNCEWVSDTPLHGLAFVEADWPRNRTRVRA